MTLLTSIKVDLTQHALDKLVERQPVFINFTVEDSSRVIDLLNQNYNSGIIHRIVHKYSPTQHDLEIPKLSGVFYIAGHSELPDTYSALTFKLLRARKQTSTLHQATSIQYSFDRYTHERKERVMTPQEIKEIYYLARCFRIQTKGRTFAQIKSEVLKMV
jgi:hypothetical protein